MHSQYDVEKLATFSLLLFQVQEQRFQLEYLTLQATMEESLNQLAHRARPSRASFQAVQDAPDNTNKNYASHQLKSEQYRAALQETHALIQRLNAKFADSGKGLHRHLELLTEIAPFALEIQKVVARNARLLGDKNGVALRVLQ